MSRMASCTRPGLLVTLATCAIAAFAGCTGYVDQPPGGSGRADGAPDPDPDDPDASIHDPDPDAEPDPDPDDPDASTPDPDPEPDAGPPDETCGDWETGTLTGYNNSDLGDDPNAGSVVEFTGLTDAFYDNVPMAAIDSSDWDGDKYHWIDVDFDGQIGRVGTWDLCRNQDCPDGTDCCTANKQRYAFPGYLVDLETRTAQRLFGVDNAESSLNHEIRFRICGSFDPDAIAAQYGAYRW